MNRPNLLHMILWIALGSIGVLSMVSISFLVQNRQLSTWHISQNAEVNFTFTMQLMVLPVSFLALAITYFGNRTGFKTFFRTGFVRSTANPPQQHHWKWLGPLLAIAFTGATMAYMSVSVLAQQGTINEKFYHLLPLVLLFAATNAWTEEIFTRFVIVTGLYGKLKPDIICWISALIFGLPHFFGTPNGIGGVFMAGFMGWLLAKSVIETRGIGWALFIHFLQDVVIFGAGAMVIAGQQ